MLKKPFEEKIAAENAYIEQHKKKYNSLTNLRLLVGVLCFIITYVFIEMKVSAFYWVGAAAFYILFIKCVQKHKRVKEQLQRAKGLITINEDYLKRLNGEWTHFEDKGEEFGEENHPYALDLDIVGEKSLFQLICVAHTWHGRRALAKILLTPHLEEEEILLRQQATKELTTKLDWIQKVEYVASKDKAYRQEPKALLNYSLSEEKGIFLSKTVIRSIIGITLISLALAIVLGQTALYAIALLGAIIQLGLTAFYSHSIGHTLGVIRETHYKLEAYTAILETLKEETFMTKKLKEIKRALLEEEGSALKGLVQLTAIVDRANLTLQPLLAIPLNALLLWNVRSSIQLEEWKKVYGKSVQTWLEVIGELESLMSLSILWHLNEEVNYPLLETKGMSITAKNLGHPLINSEIRVTNDVEIKNSLWIITGSNMSGKTTFLRTIGINLVLAYSGAPIIGQKMQTGFFNIYTSMRIRDDLKEGISTFYAELIRIKSITEASKDKCPMLFLVDEIFRGTNSIDRITGAKSVLKGLNKEGVIGAITTHDLELCALETYGRIKNFHFTEYYEEDKIKFDYKLKEGPSTSTNAKYLMKMVGIELAEE